MVAHWGRSGRVQPFLIPRICVSCWRLRRQHDTQKELLWGRPGTRWVPSPRPPRWEAIPALVSPMVGCWYMTPTPTRGRTPAPHTCTPLTGGAQQRLLNDQVVTRWSIRWALAQYGGHERLQLHVVEHLARPIMQLYKLFTALVCALRLRQAQPQPAGRLERLYDRAPTIAIDLEPPRDRLRLHCGDIHVRQRVRIGADHQRVVFEPRHDAAVGA